MVRRGMENMAGRGEVSYGKDDWAGRGAVMSGRENRVTHGMAWLGLVSDNMAGQAFGEFR